MFNDKIMMDEGELKAFVQGQANEVERQAAIQATEGITYPDFVVVDTSGNPFSPGVTFTSSESAGKAKFINGNADDVPYADSKLNAQVKPVLSAGIGYGYGWEEVNQSRLYGENVIADRALAARRAYEEMLEGIVFDGDSDHGMIGFKGIDSSVARDVGSAYTKWKTTATATSAQTIFNDIAEVIKKTGFGSRPTANRVLIEDSQYNIASAVFFGDNTSLTAINLIEQRFNVQVQGVSGLTDSTGKGLIIAYRRARDVVTLKLPMPHRFLPVQVAGSLSFKVPGVFRTAGVNFKRKIDIAFNKTSTNV